MSSEDVEAIRQGLQKREEIVSNAWDRKAREQAGEWRVDKRDGEGRVKDREREQKQSKRELVPVVYNTHESWPSMPEGLTLRGYQQEAIDNWFENNGRGTLKMATGSGKTIAALAIATQLYEKIQLQAVIIVCPYRHLVSQWARECEKFGLRPILAFENIRRWQSELSSQLYNVSAGNQPFVSLITTNATLTGQGLRSHGHPPYPLLL